MIAIEHRRSLRRDPYFVVNKSIFRSPTPHLNEADIIETTESAMNAFEIKWNTHGKGSVSKAFTNAYPEANAQCITPRNFESFLL
ncbi:MAG: hypothetical protein ACKOSR_11025 [Flavobacteriales bacterium]